VIPPPGSFGPPPGTRTMPAPGWTPPPRPGLIPLAPMTLGTILGASFRVLRRNPRPLVGLSLIIHAVLALVGVLVTGNLIGSATSLIGRLGDGAVPTAGQTGGVFLAYLAEFGVIALSLVGSQILQGIISVEVARGTLGERLRLQGLWARARGRIGVLIGWAFALVGVAIGFFIVITIVIVVIVAIVASTGNSNASIIVAIILSLVLFLGGLVVVVWFGVKLSLVPSVLVIERVSLRRAMARSWSLTRRYFWRTFGIELLIGVMLAVASQIIQTPVSVIALIFGGIANPTGESTTAVLSSLRVTEVATTIVGEAVAAITGIIQTASSALIYIDLRMRKEGLDLALMKFVDDRAAGIPDAVDPYSAPQVVTPPPVGVPVVPAETA
jgi:hypothetical protein